jgi:hypothetical protein
VLSRIVFLLAIAGALFMSTAAVASARDGNRDRIPDRWEKRHGLKLTVKQTRRDQDRDGMRNLAEFRAQTDPRDSDSDDDGVQDADENAGTISAIDGGKLTIALFAGGELSGLVTDATEVECGGDDEQGDDNDEQGDDNEDQGDDNEDQGDDEHGDDDGENGDDDEGDDGCTAGALALGATVEEADLKVTSAGAIWDEIELR